MALARWKDLCLDAADPWRLGAFWAVALGLGLEALDDGDVVLRGPRPGQTVWVNRVPEPRTVKHRVHLDLSLSSAQPLLDAGARVIGDEPGDGWLVLADPEGGELCVFPTDDPSALVVDSLRPELDAAWWADVLGARTVTAPGGLRRWIAEVPGLPFDVVKLVGVPEAKTAKNRVHWDVTCDDVPALLERGAVLLRPPDEHGRWHVLADPAGNEFCAFPSRG